jgi:hypothetical protein
MKNFESWEIDGTPVEVERYHGLNGWKKITPEEVREYLTPEVLASYTEARFGPSKRLAELEVALRHLLDEGTLSVTEFDTLLEALEELRGAEADSAWRYTTVVLRLVTPTQNFTVDPFMGYRVSVESLKP